MPPRPCNPHLCQRHPEAEVFLSRGCICVALLPSQHCFITTALALLFYPWGAAGLPLPPQDDVGEPCSKEQSREPRNGPAFPAIAPCHGSLPAPAALPLLPSSFPKFQAACAASGQGIGLGGASQCAELGSAHSLRFAHLPGTYRPGLWSGDQSQITAGCRCCCCACTTSTPPAANTFLQLLCPPCFQAEPSRQHWSCEHMRPATHLCLFSVSLGLDVSQILSSHSSLTILSLR